MSRVGKKPIIIPSGITVEKTAEKLLVKGPNGTLELPLHPKIELSINSQEISVNVKNQDNKKERSLWGLYRALVQNAVLGAVKSFEKKLEVNGVGFKVELSKVQQAIEGYKKKKLEGENQNKPGQIAESEYALGQLAQMSGNILEMRLGFSHPIFVQIPAEITVTVEKNIITISGASKQQVGQFAAEVRELKKPEPYKGKGIKYSDEVILRKAGKVVKTVGGK